jgi:hypothetical protein
LHAWIAACPHPCPGHVCCGCFLPHRSGNIVIDYSELGRLLAHDSLKSLEGRPDVFAAVAAHVVQMLPEQVVAFPLLCWYDNSEGVAVSFTDPHLAHQLHQRAAELVAVCTIVRVSGLSRGGF